MKNSFDVVVIGAGSGGLTSAVGFAKVGKKVLLIEQEHIGGECTNSGCIPSKALLHHAKQYYWSTQIAGNTTNSETYRQQAFTYVQSKIAEILAEETVEHFTDLGIEVRLGEAVFTSPNSLICGDDSFFFKKAIVATGSSPRSLSVPGLSEDYILTNQNFFQQSTIPAQLLIIGAGPIGMEMGQAMAMLGSQVTMIDNGSTFARLEDPSIQPIIKKAFTDLGIKIFNNASVTKCDYTGLSIEIQNNETGQAQNHVLPFAKILVAIGRVPNLPAGLDKAGVASTTFGITVNKNWQTANKDIYALGDVSARMKFTHVADDTARQVIAHVLSLGILRVKEKAIPKVTYTEPEMAQVGLSWELAKDAYQAENIRRTEVSFKVSDRARTDDATEGVVVIIAKRLSGKIIGAHIAGPRAGELISTITLAMENSVSMYGLRSTIFAYPTYSLILKKAGDYFFASQIADLKFDLLNLLKKVGPKIAIALLWLWGLIELYAYQQTFGLSASELSIRIFKAITTTAWGPILYILAYTIRPLTFFPGTALTILSGVFFGLWGILYTIIGANLSATVAYFVGRFFSKGNKSSLLANWTDRLNKSPFLTVLTMRLIFLPFDVVNYGAGLCRISYFPYIMATFVGTLLGISTFVAIGASLSVEEFAKNGITANAIDAKFLILSLVIFLASLGVSKLLKKN